MAHASDRRAGTAPVGIADARWWLGGVVLAAVALVAALASLRMSGEPAAVAAPAPRAQARAAPSAARAAPASVEQRLWRSASPQADLDGRIDIMAAQASDRGASVRGTDADRDGVRDDIQRYIDQTWIEPTERAAVQHYAARQQALLETASRAAARDQMRSMLRSLECVGRLSGNAGLMRSKDVLAMTLNTPQRRQAYDRAMARVAGALFFESAGDPCA